MKTDVEKFKQLHEAVNTLQFRLDEIAERIIERAEEIRLGLAYTPQLKK